MLNRNRNKTLLEEACRKCCGITGTRKRHQIWLQLLYFSPDARHLDLSTAICRTTNLTIWNSKKNEESAQKLAIGRKTTDFTFQLHPSNRHTYSTVPSSSSAMSFIFYSILALQVWGEMVNHWLSISEWETNSNILPLARELENQNRTMD